MIPPGPTQRHGEDVIDLAGFATTSWSLNLASMMIALEYLEADLLPGSAVPRLSSHVARLWLANSRGLSRRRRDTPRHEDDSRDG
jgi:hypothetical protein